MNNSVLLAGLRIVAGLSIGAWLTQYTTSDLVTQAAIEAEIKFNELLEAEKIKFSKEISTLTELKENLESTLISTETVIDSLNITISTRSEQLNQIKKEYDKQLSNVDGMSHNELTDFFSKRYPN